jgi:hypothetical protein
LGAGAFNAVAPAQRRGARPPSCDLKFIYWNQSIKWVSCIDCAVLAQPLQVAIHMTIFRTRGL